MARPRRLHAALCAGLLISAPLAAPARAESRAAEAGWGVGSLLSTLPYASAKVLYATSGLLFGGLGYVLSGGDSRVADVVIAPAVRGDYIVTPAHLRREQPLEFIGGMAAARTAATAANPWGAPDRDSNW